MRSTRRTSPTTAGSRGTPRPSTCSRWPTTWSTAPKARLAAAYLVEDIEKKGGHLSTGFIGTKDLDARARRRSTAATSPTGCCSTTRSPRGASRSSTAPPASGSVGTAGPREGLPGPRHELVRPLLVRRGLSVDGREHRRDQERRPRLQADRRRAPARSTADPRRRVVPQHPGGDPQRLGQGRRSAQARRDHPRQHRSDCRPPLGRSSPRSPKGAAPSIRPRASRSRRPKPARRTSPSARGSTRSTLRSPERIEPPGGPWLICDPGPSSAFLLSSNP